MPWPRIGTGCSPLFSGVLDLPIEARSCGFLFWPSDSVFIEQKSRTTRSVFFLVQKMVSRWVSDGEKTRHDLRDRQPERKASKAATERHKGLVRKGAPTGPSDAISAPPTRFETRLGSGVAQTDPYQRNRFGQRRLTYTRDKKTSLKQAGFAMCRAG